MSLIVFANRSESALNSNLLQALHDQNKCETGKNQGISRVSTLSCFCTYQRSWQTLFFVQYILSVMEIRNEAHQIVFLVSIKRVLVNYTTTTTLVLLFQQLCMAPLLLLYCIYLMFLKPVPNCNFLCGSLNTQQS